MGIGEVSKDQVNFPKENIVENLAGADQPAPTTVKKQARDTIENLRKGDKQLSSPIPASPDEPLMPAPQSEKVILTGQEKAISENRWLAGSGMTEFYLITTDIAEILSESRFINDAYRMSARQTQYDLNMEMSDLRHDIKSIEASKEFVRSMGSMVNSMVASIETVKSAANSTIAQKQYDDLVKQQDLEATNFATEFKTGLKADGTAVALAADGTPAVSRAEELIVKNGIREIPNPNFNPSQPEHAVDNPRNLRWDEGDIAARPMDQVLADRERFIEAAVRNPPDAIKNDTVYKQLKVKEKTVDETRKNYSNVKGNMLSNLDNTLRSTGTAIKSMTDGLMSAGTGSLDVIGADKAREEQITNAELDLLRSYYDQSSKAVDQDKDIMNEVLRNSIQVYDKMAHASFKSA
jgi:hypothetical protein